MKMSGVRSMCFLAGLAAVLSAGASASAQEVKPGTQEVKPGTQEVKPGTQEVKPGTQQVKSGTLDKQAFQAKLAYCQTCHSISAQGFRGSFPIPRLAGQQPEYLANQLQAFIERRRTNPVMNNVAHVLSPEMVAALAASFKAFDPPPLGGAPKALVPAGKKIYEEGIPEAEVPPCSSCHGDDAKGNGIFPRLAGQLNDYIIRKVTNWNKERGQDPAKPDNSAMMEAITHKLTPQQLAEVAAYVSTLK